MGVNIYIIVLYIFLYIEIDIYPRYPNKYTHIYETRVNTPSHAHLPFFFVVRSNHKKRPSHKKMGGNRELKKLGFHSVCGKLDGVCNESLKKLHRMLMSNGLDMFFIISSFV
jgi:hypothetical protein